MKVLITTSSFGAGDNAPLEIIKNAGYEPILNPYKRKLTEQELIELINEYKPEGIIAGIEPITEQAMMQAAGLRAISRCGIGMDNVDVDAAHKLRIKVTNTPDAPTLSVAELTVGLMLSAYRNICIMDRGIREGKWTRPMGRLLSKKTIGIIGCGRIGTTVAKLLSGFNCEILGFDPAASGHPLIKMVSLDYLFSASDIITIHTPYNDRTKRLINEDSIMKLKKGVLIINTSRGGLIDEHPLYEAIKSGDVRAAGIDCFEKEPYTGELKDIDNTVLTSHVGSYAEEARVHMEIEAAQNLINALGSGGAIR